MFGLGPPRSPTVCWDGSVCVLPAWGKRRGCLLVCDNKQGELRDDLPKARHKHSSNSLWAGRVGWHLKCFQTLPDAASSAALL